MRFVVLVTPEQSALPTAAALWRYNEELALAGVLLAADGPAASAWGARVRFADGRATLDDGESAGHSGRDSGEGAATGYWVLDVPSRPAVVEWMSRCPYDGELEIRRVPEPAFAALSPEHEEYLRAQVAHR
jgi:hypothetical protein